MKSQWAQAGGSVALLLLMSTAFGDDHAENGEAEQTEASAERQYTYAWMFTEDDAMRPRGGSTRGPGVQLDKTVSDAWLALQESELTAQERDRRAILAMAGGYRASFDFIETVGFVDSYEPEAPYQSWGTEYVYVVKDEPDFVSLQHVLVMFFEMEDGEVSDPIVVKHWRQDWQYQDTDLHVYVGHNTWQRREFSAEEVVGTWSQSVFQVDDSPRYQANGRWVHHGNYSSWESENTWRPLPRREYSVREDYHTLSGTNRHTITPTGWIHEEDNLKLVLDENGEPRQVDPYLAREAGFNRYERIVDHDFSAGDAYWDITAAFWEDVRSAWDTTFAEHETVVLHRKVDEQSMFMVMFGYAGELESAEDYDPEDGRNFIAATIESFLDVSDVPMSSDASTY